MVQPQRSFTLSPQGTRALMSKLSACVVLMLMTFVLRAPLHAQATTVNSPCEPGLVKPTNDPLAYGLRGERCEGVYVRAVAGTGGFSVVAFVTSGKPPAIEAGKAVAIEWPAGFDTPVFLRAVSLRRRLYYRMDARRPAASMRFDWPSDVLSDLALKIDEVGIVGWSEKKMGENVQDVYVPIRLGGAPATSDQSSYVLQVVSGSDLKEVFVRLATADASGREQQVIIRDESLKRGFYPAERAIPIPISVSTLKERGLYRLQLNAVLSNGRPSSRTLYFQHAGG
jgi:hypothetical protein